MTRSLAAALLLTCATPARPAFTTVIHAPPTVIGDDESIGSDTQLNVAEGGEVGEHFNVGARNDPGGNIELNITGGRVGEYLDTYAGSTTNLSGGVIGSFTAHDGSTVNITGGEVPRRSEARFGSTVNVLGGRLSNFMVANAGSTVNVIGGEVVAGFSARSESAINISGGRVGDDSEARENSTVNITGGTVASRFKAMRDSNVTLSGGNLGQRFAAYTGSNTTIVGNDFRFNGVPYHASSLSLNTGQHDDEFTGVFADGTPFIFARPAGDLLRNVSLVRTEVPGYDLAPLVVDETTGAGAIPRGLRPGQSLALRGSASLTEGFTAHGATMVVDGGSWDGAIEVIDTNVDVRGLSVPSPLWESRILYAFEGSRVRVTGDGFTSVWAYSGTDVDIRGGAGFVRASGGSSVTIAGGGRRSVRASDDSSIRVTGGVAPFLTVSRGSSLQVTGGVIGTIEAHSGSHVTTNGGIATDGSRAHQISANDEGTVVSVSGGTYDGGLRATRGATINANGGTFSRVIALTGSTVNFAGGETDYFFVDDGSAATISGGTISGPFLMQLASTVHLLGTAFAINGQSLDLLPSETVEINAKNQLLTATLADGSLFTFDMNSTADLPGRDYYHPDSTLLVTRVGPTGSPGDYDGNARVEHGDLDLVLQNWGVDTTTAGIPSGWLNDLPTGQVDQAELDAVLQHWGSTGTPVFKKQDVPEPAAVTMAIALGCLRPRSWRWPDSPPAARGQAPDYHHPEQ